MSWLSKALGYLKQAIGIVETVEPVIVALDPALAPLVPLVNAAGELLPGDPPATPLPAKDLQHQREQIASATKPPSATHNPRQ